MTLKELDIYFRSILNIEELERSDSSMNGVQVGELSGDANKVAFAVDACQESFERAVEWGADVLFVHHGLYWGRPLRVTGAMYKRIKTLVENNLALYAAHLPLDLNADFGNNAGIAGALDLQDVVPFGSYKGTKIGVKGSFASPKSVNQITEMLFGGTSHTLGALAFGPEEVKTVGIISGGATYELDQAIEEGLDLYITGDSAHHVYHSSLENRINVIFGGHYQTEVFGVRSLAKKVKEDKGLETVFLDIPTGL